jgi:protein-disulfide isomerase
MPPDAPAAVSPADHILGPHDAPVTLIEYGDFECPNCRQAAPAVKLLVARFSAQLRFVWREFPLEEVHPHALGAALAAEAAGGQGKFWKMHDLLLAHQDHLRAKQLRAYAEQLELDMARYDAEIEDDVYLQRIREHQEDGHRAGVRGTPGFFLDGRFVDVSFGIEHLVEAVERAAR